MRMLSYALFSLAVFGLTQWPAYGQAKKETPKTAPQPAPNVSPPTAVYGPPPGPSLRHLDGRKLVFAIEGGGDNVRIANNLQEVLGSRSLPVRVQMVNWSQNASHRQDFLDHQAQLAAARRVAGWTQLILRDCPGADIYFVGFGAGARVALAAAEQLPDKSVERILLVAPGVSRDYDLRPALMVSRAGIDSYWSPDDDCLERLTEKFGTADGRKGFAAGRVPFRIPPTCDALGADMYRTLLRQHKFSDGLCGRGGHCSWVLKPNLKRCVVPLILQPHLEYHAAASPQVVLPAIVPPAKTKTVK